MVDIIRREKIEVIVCYSQAGADLARHIIAGGLRNWPDIPVICGAERLLMPDRIALEAAFGPGVFETYGSREVMLMASECPAHAGLHTSMETLVVEVVVREGERTERPTPASSARWWLPTSPTWPCRSSVTPTVIWRCPPCRGPVPAGAPSPVWPPSKGG